MTRITLLLALLLLALPTAARAEIRIVAVGDSSFRGGPSMTNPDGALPARLQLALRAKGHAVAVANAGINGEKSWETLRRLDYAVPQGTHIALVSVGGNDIVYQHAGRGQVTARIKEIVERLRARNIEVLVFRLGGRDAQDTAEAETRDLQSLGAYVKPPMQSGGLLQRKDLHVEKTWEPQTTLWHLNREGNDIVVDRILPTMETIIAKLHARGID